AGACGDPRERKAAAVACGDPSLGPEGGDPRGTAAVPGCFLHLLGRLNIIPGVPCACGDGCRMGI
ncbi:MAG: hypothetical protein KJ052_21820, partial [Candidatus Hydrogenedentes bacterium]|nr:hypothetical protein [Candidatus Hydrogenedentota bacterium]